MISIKSNVLCIFAGLYIGCAPFYVDNYSSFVRNPQTDRIDNARLNKVKKPVINGYLRFTPSQADPYSFTDTIIGKDVWTEVDTTVFHSIASEPAMTFGCDLGYSHNNLFALGGSMHFCSKAPLFFINDSLLKIQSSTGSYLESSFWLRFTRKYLFLTIGYKPEIGICRADMLRTIIEDGVKTVDRRTYAYYIILRHSAFLRVEPVRYGGFFLGIQHKNYPYALMGNEIRFEHLITPYYGLGVNILSLFTVDCYFSHPVLVSTSNYFTSNALGIILGIDF